MSSLVKTEAGLSLQGRTFMREIGKTEFTWLIENIWRLQLLRKTPISPKFSIGDTAIHGTFHLELEMCWPEPNIHDFFLVKDQPGAVLIRAKVLYTKMTNMRLLFETFSISEKEKHQLCYSSGGYAYNIVTGFEFTCIEPVSE